MGLYDHLITALLILTVYIIQGSFILVEAQNTKFSYLRFSSPDNFSTVDDVLLLGGSFLLNSGAYSLGSSSCGRLYYKDRVRMKDDASGAVASFNTSFTFSITGSTLDNFHGDGMAFTFSKNNSSVEWDGDGDGGGWLCLVTATSNAHLFAVEFDTYQNTGYNDSSDSHIGVDVNSLNSTWSYNLCEGEQANCTYLVNGGYFTAWIDYDSPSQKLAVYFAAGSLINYVPKPHKPFIEEALNLTVLLDEYMYVGFSASIGLYKEVHEIKAWQFATTGLPDVTNSDTSSGERKVRIIAGVCAGVGAVLMLAGIVIAMRRRRASHTKQGTKFNFVDQNLVPRVFTYKELSKATKNFSRSEMLGSGGFGAVYKGFCPPVPW